MVLPPNAFYTLCEDLKFLDEAGKPPSVALTLLFSQDLLLGFNSALALERPSQQMPSSVAIPLSLHLGMTQ